MLDEAKREKMETKEKDNLKKNRKLVFLGGGEEFFIKMIFLRKMGEHYLCSEGTKNAHFRCNYLFLEMALFCNHSKSPNTTKIGVSAAHGETQNGTFGCKGAILEGASKGGFTLCDT